MNHEKVRAVLIELFEESGALGHFRQRYSVAVINEFVEGKSAALAQAIVSKVGEKFEEHAVSVVQEGLGDKKADEPALPADAEGNLVQAAEPEVPPATSSQAGLTQPAAQPLVSPSDQPAVSALSNLSPGEKPATLQKPMPVTGRGDPMPRKFSFRLKGGKLQSGVPYEGRIESTDGAVDAIAHVMKVQLPSEMGLFSDESDPARIFGIPAVSGDVSIRLSYRVEASGADEKELTSSISVFINHDPKSLWKDLPSDQSDPYWKPDTDTAMQLAGERKMVAASKRGRSHAHEGKFRDDDFRITHSVDSGWTVIAVADGAGSASKSRYGSKIAVGRAVDVLLDRLASEDGKRLEESVSAWSRGEIAKEAVISLGLYPVLGIAAFEACKAIESEASSLGVAARELSTTLLITAYKRTPLGHLFATYWVGDGGVGVYLNDGTPRLLGKVDSGEFAGQTRFLDSKVMTTEEIAARLHFALVDDFKALIAMTDGITDPHFMTDNNLESGVYWGKLWAEIDPALNADDPQDALLAWLDFWSPGNHDDRTIAVLW